MLAARLRGLAWYAAPVVVFACGNDETPPVASAGSSGAAGIASAGKSGSGGAEAMGSTGGTTKGGAAGHAAGAPSQAGTGGSAPGAGGSGHGGTGAGTGGSAGTSGASSGAVGGPRASEAGGAGAAGSGEGGNGGAAPGDSEIPPGYVKAVIGVGYGGIRIASRDGGNTWGDRVFAAPNGGDDEDLLRAVTYGKGRWLASGWKLMTSDDGLYWSDHGKWHDGLIKDEQIIEGLAYKDGYFYAAGDGSPSRLYRSPDGLTWSYFGPIGETVKHTGLTYRGGVFVSYGDSNTSYRSSDGTTWTELGIDEATYCERTWKSLDDCFGAWWSDEGYYLIPEWGGDIRRSTSGQNFKTVYSDDQQNTLYRSRAVAEGYVAPR